MRPKTTSKSGWVLSFLSWITLVFCGLLPAAASGAEQRTGEIQVAAAADLQFALDAIAHEFQRLNPEIRVQISYGSSGNFYSQILNQAPFDIYFSADLSYPRKLAEEGLAIAGSDFVYAVGRLALWVPKSSALDVKHLGMAALRLDTVQHIAIANPKHAPYGKAAEAAIRSMGFYDAVQSKLVFGENVAQAFQFVQSGASEIGIIALSLALAPGVRDQGEYWEVPVGKYPRLEQGGIIVKWAKNPGGARELRAFVLGAQGRAILKNFGYLLPGD